MRLLALDLSTSCSGWSIFEDGELVEFGSFKEASYKGKSKDRYPVKTIRVGRIMAENLDELTMIKNPDKIVIEEVCSNGVAGIKSTKGLSMLHGIYLMLISSLSVFNNTTFLSPREWRGAVGLKKNGDFKISSVNLANKMYNLSLSEGEHDISDSILLGTGYLKLGGNLEKKV